VSLKAAGGKPPAITAPVSMAINASAPA